MSIILAASVAFLGGTASGEAASRAGTAKPDLAVVRVSVPPGAAEALDVTDVLAVRGRAKATVVRYYLSRDRKRNRGDVRLIGSRSATARTVTRSARLRVPASVARGSYFVVACADDTRRVRERNERNNCRASSGRVDLLDTFRPKPVSVTETPDAARAVSADIGPAGGSLTAVAADGSRPTTRPRSASRSTSCPATTRSGCRPDVLVPALVPASVHWFVFDQSHAAEKVGANGVYRLKSWQRVSGAGWALEPRFERSHDGGDWSWTENTRFFLRHAPVSG